MARHTIRQEVAPILAFVALIWIVFLVSRVLPFNLNAYGITPRTLHGLAGIVCSPFLHADLAHITGNTIPLIVLLLLLAGSQPNTWTIVTAIILASGSLLWLVGRHATHVGASGLIFGLAAYLIVAGFREDRIIPLLVALAVGFLYGGALAAGMVPRLGSHVSWDGHLTAAAAGAIVAWMMTSKQDAAGLPDYS